MIRVSFHCQGELKLKIDLIRKENSKRGYEVKGAVFKLSFQEGKGYAQAFETNHLSKSNKQFGGLTVVPWPGDKLP